MEKKLKIIAKDKSASETVTTTIRIPCSLLSQVDKIAEDTGYTRNELVNKFIEFSIENIEIIK